MNTIISNAAWKVINRFVKMSLPLRLPWNRTISFLFSCLSTGCLCKYLLIARTPPVHQTLFILSLLWVYMGSKRSRILSLCVWGKQKPLISHSFGTRNVQIYVLDTMWLKLLLLSRLTNHHSLMDGINFGYRHIWTFLLRQKGSIGKVNFGSSPGCINLGYKSTSNSLMWHSLSSIFDRNCDFIKSVPEARAAQYANLW